MANNHYPIKQVIVVRKDLNYGTKGKLAAQVAHASVGALLQTLHLSFEKRDYFNQIAGHCNDASRFWIEGDFAKIVLSVPSESEMLALIAELETTQLPWVKIEDNGTTVFDGIKTLTAIGIGPAKSDVVDTVTSTKEYIKLL
jgi:peptidyl-tRNA hydrolase